MFKDDFRPIFTREGVVGFRGRRIDRKFLIENIVDFSQCFYVCGPAKFVEEIVENLKALGADSKSLIFDE